MPVFFAVVFFAAAVLRAGFFFVAVFLFAAAILHPSFGLAGCQEITLATSARRSTRIALETRAVANEGKVPAFSTRFSFITLNARFGHKI